MTDPSGEFGVLEVLVVVAVIGILATTLTGCGKSPSNTGPRYFVFVVGDQGSGEHNSGDLFKMAAATHEREIRSGTHWQTPKFSQGDQIKVICQ